jgi:hypothetical protein
VNETPRHRTRTNVGLLLAAVLLLAVFGDGALAATGTPSRPHGCTPGVRWVRLPAHAHRRHVPRLACVHRVGRPTTATTIQPIPRFAASPASWAGQEVAATESVIVDPLPPTPVDPFADRPANAVAVVALDETGGGPEYQALATMGVPAWIARSFAEAARAPVVVLAGTLDAPMAASIGPNDLRAYVNRGGVLVGEAVTALSVGDLFGFDEAPESRTRARLAFAASAVPMLRDIDTAEERDVPLDDVAQATAIGTVGHMGGAGQALATFDDGSRAVSVTAFGYGAAIAIGARYLDLTERHQEGARFSPRSTYANGGETDADVWALLLRGIWRQYEPGGLTLGTSPAGTAYAVIPTISASWSAGARTTLHYLDAIRTAGPQTTSTVFVPTRYVDDWLDTAFWNDSLGPVLGGIARRGGQLGSESVSHSAQFDRLPVGTGKETYASYVPFIEGVGTCTRPARTCSRTVDATLTGELRVSRQLIGGVQPSVTAFRAPFLEVSRELAQAEDATGYTVDSSTTQGWVQGAFPFHPPRLDGLGYTTVFELPIAIEDGAPPRFDTRVDDALTTIARNGANGAPSVVMISPSDSARKLAAVGRLFGGLPADAWVGSADDFGRFWRQRSHLRLATVPSQSTDPACDGAVRGFALLNDAGEVATGQTLDATAGDLAVVRDDAGTVTTLPVTAGRIVLPDIAPHGHLRGLLCGVYAAGEDLWGQWTLDPDGTTVTIAPAPGDATHTVYDGTVDVAGQPTQRFVLTEVAPGRVCITDYRGPLWLECGALSADRRTITGLVAHSVDPALEGTVFSLQRI